MHKPLWLRLNLTKLILLGFIIAILMAFVASCGLSTGIPIASGQNNSTAGDNGSIDGGDNGSIDGGDNGSIDGGDNGSIDGGDNGSIDGGDNGSIDGGDNGSIDGGDNGSIDGGGDAPTITGKDIIFVQDMSHCNIDTKAESHYTTTNYDANIYRVVSFITSVVNSSNPRSDFCINKFSSNLYSDNLSERFTAVDVRGSNITAPSSNDKRVILRASRLLIEDEVYTVTLYIVGKNDFIGSVEQAEASSKALGTTPATFTVTAVDLPFTIPGVSPKETDTTIGIGSDTAFTTKTIGLQSGYYDPDIFKIVPFVSAIFGSGSNDDLIVDVKETGVSDITQDGVGSVDIKATKVLTSGNFYSVEMYVIANDAPANTKTEAENSARLVNAYNPVIRITVQ